MRVLIILVLLMSPGVVMAEEECRVIISRDDYGKDGTYRTTSRSFKGCELASLVEAFISEKANGATP